MDSMARPKHLLVALVVSFAASGCDPLPPETPATAQGATDPREMQIGASDDAYADTDPSALTDFRPALDPYGRWVDDPTYGTVWIPSDVGPDFAPYVSAGHWAYDDGAYVWESEYPWGWAPFHYGRWVWADGNGWMWIPGRVYSGAWVVWRVGDDDYDYVGWAPMPPLWGWYGGVAVGLPGVVPAPFLFFPRRHLFEPGLRAWAVPHDRAIGVAEHTHVYATPAPGHVFAHPSIASPAPSSLGHDPAHLPHSAGAGVSQARAFSHPTTAAPLGGRKPAPHVVRPHAPSVHVPSRRR